MSAEFVTTIILTAASFVIILGSIMFVCTRWMLKRMDQRFDQIEARFTAGFDQLDAEFNNFYGQLGGLLEHFTEIRTELSALRGDFSDVELAIVRLKGSHPRMALSPHMTCQSIGGRATAFRRTRSYGCRS